MSEPGPVTRRVVTGKDADGVDGIIDDRRIEAAETRGGNRVSMIWSASELPPRPDELEDPGSPAWTKRSIPETAGARWSIAHIPPLSSRSAAEVGNAVGMHATDTLDFILIAGPRPR